MARRSPPRKVTYFEPVPPRLARNTIIESTFEVGRRFRCTMRIDCGQLDPGAVIRPEPGEWQPRMPERLDEEDLRTGAPAATRSTSESRSTNSTTAPRLPACSRRKSAPTRETDRAGFTGRLSFPHHLYMVLVAAKKSPRRPSIGAPRGDLETAR